MRWLGSVVGWMTLAVGWVSGDGIVGPDQVDEHRLVRLTSDTPASVDAEGQPTVVFFWDVYPFEQADIDEDPDGELVFTAPPGRYLVQLRVINFATREGKTFRKEITIAGKPGPGPDPDPDPDPDPGPTDPLVTQLRGAYASETGEKKAEHLAALAVLYRQAITTASATNIVTAKQLLEVLQTARKAVMPDDALPMVRGQIQGFLNETMPRDVDAVLNNETRLMIQEAFQRIAAALEEVARGN